jgi:SAM-dependent methyltransferase
MGTMSDRVSDSTQALRTSYDLVAEEYTARIYGELADKPLDRALLDRFADSVRDHGPVCELGCGPGHVARYLHDRGVNISGMDLSPNMVAEARKQNPDIPFRVGDMRALEDADSFYAGVVAFYSLIHIPREEMLETLREIRRVLRAGGKLLIAFHIGEETVHLEEWWGQAVSADFHFFQSEEMRSWLEDAGFHVEEVTERPPYPGVEHPSHRAYILAYNPEL